MIAPIYKSTFFVPFCLMIFISSCFAQAGDTYHAVIGGGFETRVKVYSSQPTCGSPIYQNVTYTGPTALILRSDLPLVKSGKSWQSASVTEQSNADGVNETFTSTISESGIVTTYEIFGGLYNVGDFESGSDTEVLDLNTGKYTFQFSENDTIFGGACPATVFNSSYNHGYVGVALLPSLPDATLNMRFANPAAANGSPLPLAPYVPAETVNYAPIAAGLAADGSSALAIVVHSNSSSSPTLSLSGAELNTGTTGLSFIGSLTDYRADYLTNPQPGLLNVPLTISTPIDTSSCNSQTDKAGNSFCTFVALLWAPTTMPYSASDLSNLQAEDIKLTVTVTQNDVSGVSKTFANSTILVPPPLLLVHGVWSSAAEAWPTFHQWLTQNYPYTSVFPADYGRTSYLSFKNDINQQVLTQTITNAISAYAQQGIAAEKVDIVAHSMGGLLARYFEENGLPGPFPPSSLPQNSIHSLITIGTPHIGTPMASTLWTYRNTNVALTHLNPIYLAICVPLSTCTLSQLLLKQGRPVDTAVEDLQAGLGLPPMGETYRSIAGDAPPVSGLGSMFNALLAAYVPGTHTISTIMDTTDNDALVPGASQLAGAQDTMTINGIVHSAGCCGDVGETQSPAIFNQALYWLMGGAGPIPSDTMQHDASNNVRPLDSSNSTGSIPLLDLTGYMQIPATNVTFLPPSGSTLTIGTPTTITTTSAKTLTEVLLYQIVIDPTDTLLSYSNQAPYSIVYTPSRIGSANFVAFAVFSDNTFATLPLNYTLQPSGNALGLSIQAPVASLPIGLTTSIPAQAGFSNGIVDVTNVATYTARSGGTGVFSVGTNGSITTIGNGFDWLDVSYGGQTASATITVGSCAYSLGPTNQIIQEPGGSATIQVTTQDGCSWTADPGGASWLTLSGASGVGSGIISASAPPNSTGATQTAFITVAGQDVAIIQPGSVCSYTLGTTQVQSPAAGTSGSIAVMTSCPLIATSSQPWVIATALSSSVNYVIAANASTSARTAEITIGDEAVEITQAGVSLTTPTVTVSPSASSITMAQALNVTVAVGGGSGNPAPTGSVTLTSGDYASAATTLSGGSAIISIPAGSLATGTDTLTVSYTPDSSSSSIYNSASNTALVTVTAQAKTTPTVAVIPSSSNFTTAQAPTVTIAVSGVAGNPTPTGSVTLTSGSYTSSVTTLSSGIATINIPAGSMAAGTDTLTANYSGDANYNGTTGTASVTVTTPASPSFTVSGTAVSVAPGATTGNTAMVTVTPGGGFTGNVALAAALTSSPTGAQNLPTLSFGSTIPVNITGASAGTATLTITTTAATRAALGYPKRHGLFWYEAGGATLACVLFLGMPGRRRSWQTMLGTLVLLTIFAGAMLGCITGGGSSGGGGDGGTNIPGTTVGTYIVTVTGTSGTNTATSTLTLTVQ